jgi:hypothetical protein
MHYLTPLMSRPSMTLDDCVIRAGGHVYNRVCNMSRVHKPGTSPHFSGYTTDNAKRMVTAGAAATI